jgi:hypothetical protein
MFENNKRRRPEVKKQDGTWVRKRANHSGKNVVALRSLEPGISYVSLNGFEDSHTSYFESAQAQIQAPDSNDEK